MLLSVTDEFVATRSGGASWWRWIDTPMRRQSRWTGQRVGSTLLRTRIRDRDQQQALRSLG